MENIRLKYIVSKRKAIAHLRRLKKGSNERSFEKIQLRLLCQRRKKSQ